MTDVIRKPWRPLLMILPTVSSKRLEAGRDDESFFNEDEDAEDEVVGEDDLVTKSLVLKLKVSLSQD